MYLRSHFLNLEKTKFCVLRFFYSITASDGSEGSTAGRVVSPCSIMMHHGFSSKEAARKQRYRLRQTTSHSSLLVARQGDVSRKLHQAFLLVDSFNFNFFDEERSDIYVYMKDKNKHKFRNILLYFFPLSVRIISILKCHICMSTAQWSVFPIKTKVLLVCIHHQTSLIFQNFPSAFWYEPGMNCIRQ